MCFPCRGKINPSWPENRWQWVKQGYKSFATPTIQWQNLPSLSLNLVCPCGSFNPWILSGYGTVCLQEQCLQRGTSYNFVLIITIVEPSPGAGIVDQHLRLLHLKSSSLLMHLKKQWKVGPLNPHERPRASTSPSPGHCSCMRSEPADGRFLYVFPLFCNSLFQIKIKEQEEKEEEEEQENSATMEWETRRASWSQMELLPVSSQHQLLA